MIHLKSHSKIWNFTGGKFHLEFKITGCRALMPLSPASFTEVKHLVSTIVRMFLFIAVSSSPATGQRGMEIVVLLLLTVSLTAATPLRSTPRSVSKQSTGGSDEMMEQN